MTLRPAPILGLILAAILTLGGCQSLPVMRAGRDVSPEDPFPMVLWEMRDGRRLYYLTHPFSYCDPTNGDIVVVPAGFETDFASVPSQFWGLFRPDGPYARAAIIHDWLYAIGLPGARGQADDIFMNAMREYGVDWPTRQAVHRSVRLIGQTGYGLERDWRFRDLRTRKLIDPPAKPTSLFVETRPGCVGYVEDVTDGSLFRPLETPFG